MKAETQIKLTHSRLYGILDMGSVTRGEALPVARRLLGIDGGKSHVDVLQLRAKGWTAEEVSELAFHLVPLCREVRVPFIVNDFVRIAVEVDADGVHLGQEDGALQMARALLAPGRIIGRSTHSLEQADQAIAEGADYIGFGPLFATPTKPGRAPIGLADITEVHRRHPGFPIFCIGGINETTLDQVIQAGAKRVVIVSALLQSEEPEAMIERAKGRL